MEYCLIMVKPGFVSNEIINQVKSALLTEGMQIKREFYKKFTYNQIKEAYYSADVKEEDYLNYLSSDEMYVILAQGNYCYYVTKRIKNKIRESYGYDHDELKNLLHSSDDGVEFYLQYLACEELYDLELDKTGYANLFITDENGVDLNKYEKKALIKGNRYLLENFELGYDYYGFISELILDNIHKVSIVNYLTCKEDLIANKAFKAVYFFEELLDKEILLKLNRLGVCGVLMNYENTNIKYAEIIFELIEECQLNWVVIGGGEHISIGQRRYNKFVDAINNKSNWTFIS